MKEKEQKNIIHPFEPIIYENSKILILGSFPSVKSRENNFYYGNNKNRFWNILSDIFNEEVPITIDDKVSLLKRNKIAVWDVIKSCDIHASEDSSIKNVVINDICGLTNKYGIENIIFNGNTAYKFYKKYIGKIEKHKEIVLPSTSPANAKIKYDELLKIWNSTIISIL